MNKSIVCSILLPLYDLPINLAVFLHTADVTAISTNHILRFQLQTVDVTPRGYPLTRFWAVVDPLRVVGYRKLEVHARREMKLSGSRLAKFALGPRFSIRLVPNLSRNRLA